MPNKLFLMDGHAARYEDWIKSDLVNREGKAVTNFAEKLLAPHSRLAHETLKDPTILIFSIKTMVPSTLAKFVRTLGA